MTGPFLNLQPLLSGRRRDALSFGEHGTEGARVTHYRWHWPAVVGITLIQYFLGCFVQVFYSRPGDKPVVKIHDFDSFLRRRTERMAWDKEKGLREFGHLSAQLMSPTL